MKKMFLLVGCALAGAFSVQAQTLDSPFTGVAIDQLDANGEYYLYNVEAGLWLQHNERTQGRWSTGAELDARGMYVKINATDGGYYIAPDFKINGSGDDARTLGMGDLYWDTNESSVFTFEADTETGVSNCYIIISSGETYLEANPDDDYRLRKGTGAGSPYWQIVSREERLAQLENATADDPIDATWLIKGSGFANNDNRRDSWSVTPDSDNNKSSIFGYDGVFNSNTVAEMWYNNEHKIQQTVAVPNGKYVVKATGVYSPTGSGGLSAAHYDARSTEKYGYLFATSGATTKQALLPSYYDVNYTERQESRTDAATKDLGNGVWVAENTGQIACQIFNGKVAETVLETITVADGQLTIGAKVDLGDASADGIESWILVDNFRLEYLGSDIDLSEYLEALEQAITNGEQAEENTAMTVAKRQELDEVLNTARAARNSTDADEISAAAQAVNSKLAEINALAANVDALKKIHDLAFADGVIGDPLANAEDYLQNGTDADALNTVLDDLRVARKVANIETMEPIFQTSEPGVGEYYIYNVGRKAFFSSGSDWGTHAALGWPGLVATLASAENGYTIQFNELIQGDARDKFLNGTSNTAPYVDGEDSWKTTYTFEAIDNKPGVYAIKGSNGRYLAFDPNGDTDASGHHYNTISTWDNYSSEDAQWMLVTRQQRLDLMDEASVENPIDVSFLIRDASFNKHAALNNPWTDLNQSWEWGNSSFGDKNTETFNSQDYNLSQSVELPRGGVYEVSVQAYYRDGSRDAHAASVAAGEELVVAPVLYADLDGDTGDLDFSASLPYIHAAAGLAPGEGTNTACGEIPDNMIQASKYFENGLYKTTVQFTVPDDATVAPSVKIGIKKNAGNRGDNWIVADNFRLTYLGPVANLTDLNEGDDNQTIHYLSGTWNAAQFAAIDEAANGTVYDLTNVSLGTPTGGLDIETRPNVLYVVTEDQKEIINNEANILVHKDGLIYTSDNIAFQDHGLTDGSEDVFTGTQGLIIIQAQNASYERFNVTGNFGTVVLPFAGVMPDGFRAYELKLKYDDAERDKSVILQFDEHVGALSQSIPYVLRLMPGHDTNLRVENIYNTELNIRQAESQAPVDALGGYQMYSTYQTIDAAPQELYTISTNADDDHSTQPDGYKTPLFQRCTGAIGPFRGYLTLPDGVTPAKDIVVEFSDATGIRRATAEEIEQLFNVYSIDGRLVKSNAATAVGLPKGTYVINGKKVVIK